MTRSAITLRTWSPSGRGESQSLATGQELQEGLGPRDSARLCTCTGRVCGDIAGTDSPVNQFFGENIFRKRGNLTRGTTTGPPRIFSEGTPDPGTRMAISAGSRGRGGARNEESRFDFRAAMVMVDCGRALNITFLKGLKDACS